MRHYEREFYRRPGGEVVAGKVGHDQVVLLQHSQFLGKYLWLYATCSSARWLPNSRR